VNYALRLLKQQGLTAPSPEEVAVMPSVEVSGLIDGLLAKRGKPVFYGNGAFSHWQKAAGANLVPIRQRTQFTCVAASTAMSLQALGVQNCDEDTVNRVLGAAPMKGATWEQVLATAQHYGVRATLTVPATLSQVKGWTDAGKPVMIGWNPEGREWSHASVIFDVQECPTHGFMVHVADPNCPDPEQTVRIVPKSEFYSKWYEKFPNYLVRRPALVLEREVTPEGRQVMASRRSPVLVDEPAVVPVSMRLAVPKYQTYVQKKKDKGEKPLSEEGWERKVKHTGVSGTELETAKSLKQFTGRDIEKLDDRELSHAKRVLTERLKHFDERMKGKEGDEAREAEASVKGYFMGDKAEHEKALKNVEALIKNRTERRSEGGKKAALLPYEQHLYSEVPVSKQAKAPTPVVQKKDKGVVRGEAPSQRNPVVQGLIERGTSGAGKHKNPQDYARGHARAPKHKGQKGWGAEYMALPVEEALGAEYMQDHSAKHEKGVSVDPTKDMSKADAAEWKKQNAIHRSEFTASTRGLLPSEVARLRSAGADPEVAKATRLLTIATKASRAVPRQVGDKFKTEMRAFSDASDATFRQSPYEDAAPEVLKKCEEYRAQALGMLKALSGIALSKDYASSYEQGMEAVRLLPRINRNMDVNSEVAAFTGYLDRAAWVIATKAKDAEWRVYYLTQWLDFYKANGRSPSWNEQDEWLKKRRQASTRSASRHLLPSEAYRLRAARYDRGPLSPSEKNDLFEENPEFADMNENPPESVLSVREQMAKQARLQPKPGMRVQAQGVTGKGLKDGVIYTLEKAAPVNRGGPDTYTFMLRGKPVARFTEESVSMWLEAGSHGDASGLVII
jgi:hypothetical protein